MAEDGDGFRGEREATMKTNSYLYLGHKEPSIRIFPDKGCSFIKREILNTAVQGALGIPLNTPGPIQTKLLFLYLQVPDVLLPLFTKIKPYKIKRQTTEWEKVVEEIGK